MTPQEMARIHAASFDSAPRPWSLAEITELLASPAVTVFSVSGGFLMLQQTGPEAEILTIAVHPDHRRQGLARRLLDRMLEASRQAAIQEVFLEVSQRNTAAQALYLGAGFTQCGERKNYYHDHNGNKITALVMHRVLGGN